MKAFLYRVCAIFFSHFVLYPDYRISFFIPLAFRFADYKRDILPQATRDAIKDSKDIVVSGWIKKSEIPYYYSMLDVFVFPSHREGFGMCVLEASAMEKPILDSRAHGCVDAIVEHETGEYINLSAEGICRGMELMLDADLRKRLGENGRKRVLEWYDFKIMWPLVGDLYKKILK